MFPEELPQAGTRETIPAKSSEEKARRPFPDQTIPDIRIIYIIKVLAAGM